MDQLFSDKKELSGYHVILEFIIRRGNIQQRLICAEGFKKADVKSFKREEGVIARGLGGGGRSGKSSDDRLKKNVGLNPRCATYESFDIKQDIQPF